MADISSTPILGDPDIDPSNNTMKEAVLASDKEVVPSTNDDSSKQVSDRTADSAKEVYHLTPSDTDKIFVPSLPPASTDKEVAPPENDTDKQLAEATSCDSSNNSTNITPSHQFRFEKTNPMGLIMPQNQSFSIRSINPTTKLDQGAAFVTSDMEWTDVLTANPPRFELYTAHDFHRSELVARLRLKSWEGFTGMKADFEVSCQGDRQKWEVSRKGLTRTYQLRGMLKHAGLNYVWKGSTKTVKSMIGDEKKNKGNLKLCTSTGEVLAVWQQWRDSGTLGDVMIFENARDKLGVEVILTSCICVISAERANGLNWLGGFGKK